MKLLYLLMPVIFTISSYANFKQIPPEQLHKDQNQAPAINVNFSMGNSQEAPACNNAATTSTQKLHVEHKMEPLPQESMFSKVKNSFVCGAVASVASVLVHKIADNSDVIIDIIRKIVIRG